VSRAAETLELLVRCSPGTYVRALARDLGERLGTGAHLAALRRTRSGSFDLSQAVSGDELSCAQRTLMPMSALLSELPAVRVDAEGRRLVGHGRELGREVVVEGFPEGPVDRVRVLDARGELVALAVPRGFAPGAPGLARVPVLHPDLVLLPA
jgi:tRNA pseudouridine55 synthase